MRRWVHSPAYRIVIAKLVDARTAAGLTQRDLAAKLGKSPSFVGKIESGERRLDLVEFILIARAIGASEIELLRTITAALPKRIEI
jgi:transcriptional regulator with XRE-family HTH domain